MKTFREWLRESELNELNENIGTVIISGFPGIGKSYFYNKKD